MPPASTHPDLREPLPIWRLHIAKTRKPILPLFGGEVPSRGSVRWANSPRNPPITLPNRCRPRGCSADWQSAVSPTGSRQASARSNGCQVVPSELGDRGEGGLSPHKAPLFPFRRSTRSFFPLRPRHHHLARLQADRRSQRRPSRLHPHRQRPGGRLERRHAGTPLRPGRPDQPRR